ncbi:MAG: beta-propeller fold lactonase family protein [Acidobacteriota bacterium]|nr:beta-propeller fold lactonase family protein [Acidobacteriota bacterium]
MKSKNDYTRRDFLKIAAAGTTALTFAGSVFGGNLSDKKSKEMLLYIGTYTSGKSTSEGIYIYKFDAETGSLQSYKTVKNVVEPSYLTIDKDRQYLYAVNETEEYEGKKSGAVSAFRIDQKTGDLTLVNKLPSLGGAPCYIIASENGKFVLVANYVGGNVAVFPVETGGKLGAAVDLQQQTGTGPNKDRQEAAHAHSIDLDGKNRYAFSCDLGADKIYIYEFDKKTGKLNANENQPIYQTKPGAGPRHLAFHDNGKFAFLINELSSTISTLSFDAKRGTLKEIQNAPTLPADFKGENTCAEIKIAPNGKFLYGSNRGHDSLVAYRIDGQTGRLEYVENTPTGGKTPRNFVIAPNGKFLLAANQNSDSINVFQIDEASGKLTQTTNTARVSMPVCLKFL